MYTNHKKCIITCKNNNDKNCNGIDLMTLNYVKKKKLVLSKIQEVFAVKRNTIKIKYV